MSKRSNKLSKLNSKSLVEEYKEWNDPLVKKQLIWTLPDLTKIDRYKNFCRSIKNR